MRWNRTAGSVLLGVFLVTAPAAAQESFEEDFRSQPYVFGALGGFPSGRGGGTTIGVGGGMDYLVGGALGVGGELIVFGNGSFAFSVASLNASYHFVPNERFTPFVRAGIGAGGELGYAVAFGTVGVGVNLWRLTGAAIRLEVVDRFPLEGGDHHAAVQVGITF